MGEPRLGRGHAGRLDRLGPESVARGRRAKRAIGIAAWPRRCRRRGAGRASAPHLWTTQASQLGEAYMPLF